MSLSRLCNLLPVVLAVFLAIAGHAAAAPLPPSPLPRYVHDDAGWLGAHSYSALDLRLDRLETETGWKLVVAILPGLPDGEDASDYTRRLFDGWLPGGEKQDRAMLLAAYDDHTVRLLAGDAAASRLPDAERARVISEVLAKVAEGERETAIESGVESIISAMGKPVAPAAVAAGRKQASRNTWTIVSISALMVVWIVVRTIASRRASARGRR